jgi:hypothetical protein
LGSKVYYGELQEASAILKEVSNESLSASSVIPHPPLIRAEVTKVTFGGVAATSFTVNSDTRVTATVPAGAKTGKIAVTTKGGNATSTTSFTVN